MCPPTFFGVHYKINPWMSRSLEEGGGDPVDGNLARIQWINLVNILQHLDIRIVLLDPVPELPDLVFTANAGFIYDKTVIVSSFKHKERQLEEDVFRDFFCSHTTLKTVQLPRFLLPSKGVPKQDVFFEGHGDALFWKDVVFAGKGMRSNELGIYEAMRLSGLDIPCVLLELVDPNFYHLDTCLCPVGNTLLYYPKAFSTLAQRSIEKEVSRKKGTLISVSEEDAKNFVCNGVPVSENKCWHLVTAQPSPILHEQLEEVGIHVWPVAISEFLKAGGGARCLTLFI